MDLPAFQSFVRENAAWFRGVHPESAATLAEAESRLGFQLPGLMKWLLAEWGYSGACGIGSLSGAVATTLRCRTTIGLPPHLMILDDRGDAGVVCFDSRSGAVLWTDAHELERIQAGLAPLHADTFEDYPAWVISRLEDEKEESQHAGGD